ncbi:acylneuraminate cytidylyltransferase family protein [Halorubrum sp. SD690R]|uniref:acylneuraminate cytidylyltransferase family protein n=1 Tax=Halorubrum sp. SD690R TaxID=2518117 RepID=UPI0010F7EBE2|nr:acylneuraminate cytidylyltransferase family protein [Halorubrum sp. SD690R]TKX47743.1 acylneuraminate cytidylyltransferase family protein [Halorubrum sp. SD690R]
MTETEYLGIIPARGGSKGVERKNVRTLAGQPLIAHTIAAAENADKLDRTIVTTDDPEIRRVARECGAEAPFLRPDELATDGASMAPVVEHAISYLEDEENYTCSAIVLLQPTSPLRNANHIDRAVERHRTSDVTTVISTFEDHSYRWQPKSEGAKQLNYTSDVSRRQNKSSEYVENGAIYVVDTDLFLTQRNLRSGTVELFEMSERRSIDIDTEFDFWLAEQIMEYVDDER